MRKSPAVCRGGQYWRCVSHQAHERAGRSATYPTHLLKERFPIFSFAEEHLATLIQDCDLIEDIIDRLAGLVYSYDMCRTVEIGIDTKGFDESKGCS